MTLKTENTISDSAKLDIQKLGGVLWRNNSGVDTSRSRPVRYGLGNDSKQINTILKSSDLIGCVPVVVGPEHLGQTLGVMVAVEAKKQGWKYRQSDKRAVAQNNFIHEVNKRGGCGFFLNDEGLLVPHIMDTLKIQA